ncbi:MAG: ATP-grasp domain-containing protein [Chromatiales bacterium]
MPRIFVCEYITGGGLAGEALPVALAAAGDSMLRALLDDLRAIPTVKTATTRDPRLVSLDPDIETQVILPQGSVWERWEQCIEAADAVWPIAPETGGVLERLNRCVLDKNRILIGCHPQAVQVTASKFRTARELKRHHIPVVETAYLNTELPSSDGGWVIKPDDGAGCEETYYFRRAEDVISSGKWTHGLILNTPPFTAGTLALGFPKGSSATLPFGLGRGSYPAREVKLIVQPYIPGIPASLSVLCYDGSHSLLACNAQRIQITNHRLVYSGVAVNALAHRRHEFEELASRILEAMPGLRGYIGIDLVITESGPIVMEINPRLTEAYVGLRQSLQFNPAARVVDACMRIPVR